MPTPPLESFGARIMICGPSSSGKSTLAVALGRKLDVPAVHLDLFRHLPNTNWVERPDGEFKVLHDEAVQGDRWIIEGNYSSLMPLRIERATGVLLLGDHRWANFARYLRRTLFEHDRAGMLEGGQDSLNWEMVRWILVQSPKKIVRYRARLSVLDLPFLECRSMHELRRLYATWDLQRP